MAIQESLNPYDKHGIPNTNFPTDNEWGVPSLRLDRSAKFFDMPLNIWGSFSRNKKVLGTIGFYCDDYRFSNLIKNPSKVVTHTQAVSAFEINSTISLNTPKALVLEKIFYKRWISRYWQENDIEIFVDLWFPLEFTDLCLLGVPKGYNSYCTRASNKDIEGLILRHEIAKVRSDSDFPLFVVYGGGKEVNEEAMKRGWIHHPERANMVKGRFDDGNALNSHLVRHNKLKDGVSVRVKG